MSKRKPSGNTMGMFSEVTGLDELVRELSWAGKLDIAEVANVVKSAAKRIVNSAKSNASFSNRISASIEMVHDPARFPTQVLIRPKYSKAFGQTIAHLYEFGTAPRFTKSGARRGQIAARPFMRPAFDQNKDAVIKEMRVNILKLIEQSKKQTNLK